MRSTESEGNNGVFQIKVGEQTLAICIASDGAGWEHISVSIITRSRRRRLPNWSEMCKVKGIFWGPEDCVMQLHPPESDYINNAKNVLHLWRPVGEEIPRPPSILVGIKDLNLK